jgi:hypothetical protein
MGSMLARTTPDEGHDLQAITRAQPPRRVFGAGDDFEVHFHRDSPWVEGKATQEIGDRGAFWDRHTIAVDLHLEPGWPRQTGYLTAARAAR